MSHDNVKSPAHYTQFPMQPIEFIEANLGVLDPFQANIIKYICRYKVKNGIEDLNKAQNYLDRLKMQWYKDHPDPKPQPSPVDLLRKAAGELKFDGGDPRF